MITARFIGSESTLTGFSISGHAGLARSGRDILCAAVSSAAFMTANTITEIYHIVCETAVDDSGSMTVQLSAQDAQTVQPLLQGFLLHMRELTREYPKQLKVICGGKENA